MGAAASGLAAQSSRLATVADNVANAGTTGYKESGTEFYSLVEQLSPTAAYQASGVSTTIRYNVAQQGALESTKSSTDFAVQGNGFFIVQDAAGSTFLTRSGSFIPDSQGRLVNGAGFYLCGMPAGTAASAGSPVPVKIDYGTLTVKASTTASLQANLPSGAAVVPAANLPSTNTAGATYSSKTSIVAYDNVGTPVTLDVYATKTGPNTWEVATFDKSTASASGGFPYSSGPLSTQTLTFTATGTLASGGTTTIAVPNGQSMTLDMTGSTQYSSPFNVQASSQDGHAASVIDHVELAADGTLSSVFADGTKEPSYRIPLATVASPDLMATKEGTAWVPTNASGPSLIDFPQSGGRGTIIASSLEQSTVDLATELTSMIETQRAYQANSKTFQAGADILDVLVNLK